MTTDERKLVAHLFAEGCRTQLPDNIHIDLDIVRRDLHIAPTEIVERVRALGFEHEVRPDTDHGDDDVLVARWSDMIRHEEDSVAEDLSFERATEVAVAMLDVGSGEDGCRQ